MVLLLLLAGAPPCHGTGGNESLPARVGANTLHDAGITGRGVTIAVVGGAMTPGGIPPAADGHERLLAVFDALSGSVVEPAAVGGGSSGAATAGPLDALLSGRSDSTGRFQGVAPNADVVVVQALRADGTVGRRELVRGIDWVVANRDRFGIGVLNLAVAGQPRRGSPEDALSRALIGAWEAGVVVVVPAGNGGPELVTVAAPGDLPRVITVGATTGGAEAVSIAGYSASGPTLDGWAKPEIVAPAGPGPVAEAPFGGAALRPLSAGTSISSAVVSGVVALLLEASPWATPDEIKYRLVASARPLPASPGDGRAMLAQGAGAADAAGALFQAEVPDGDAGPAARGFVWSDAALRGFVWSDAGIRGMVWSDAGIRGLVWSDAALRGLRPPNGSARGLTWSD